MDPQQEIEQLKRQLKSLKESSTIKERQLNGEVNELKFELASEKRKRESLQRELEELKLTKAAPSRKLGTPKKTISELTDKKYQKREIAKIEKEQLGPSFEIIPVNNSSDLDMLSYLKFQRIHHLTIETVDALSNLPKSSWPTARQLRYFEDQLINRLGGFTEYEYEGIRMIWATEPAKVFIEYLKNLYNNVWKGKVPNVVKVVLSGDKG